jgi:endonuclease III
MAAAPTKTQKIEALVKLVQRRCRGTGLTQPPQRSVLETLIYAALIENATFDKAGLAYTVLENYYIDWNEIRVCSVRELADTLTDLPHPEAAAERVRKALQGIFEKTYMFDLEELRKKGKALAEYIKTLEAMSAGTPYMIQYVAQVALDNHLIPLDEASLRIMRRLNLSQVSSDGKQEICIGLDRVVLKKTGLTFAAQLHHFAAGYYDVPDSPELLSQLSAIDPEAVSRSWASPILTPSLSGQPPKAAAFVPSPVRETVSTAKAEVPKAEPSSGKPKTPAKAAPAMVPAKPAPKPKKLPAKPVKKPVKSAANVKRTPPKVSKVPPGKKKVLPKKPIKPSTPKKKAPVKVKKMPTKPVKKPKVMSPSKSLRKKKPK